MSWLNDIFSEFCFYGPFNITIIEPPHDKTNKMACVISKDSDQPRHAWVFAQSDQSSLFAWRKLGSFSYPLSAQRRLWPMPRLIWVFAEHTVILLVLSWDGSYHDRQMQGHCLIRWESRDHVSTYPLMSICFICVSRGFMTHSTFLGSCQASQSTYSHCDCSGQA